jgi:hypothetical protein
MIRLRIPIAQPPKPTRNSDANGTNQCQARSARNAGVKDGSTAKL